MVNVLIVPSGIETHNHHVRPSRHSGVLIVPSGIETNIVAQNSIRQVSINCT